ncbi:MAG TPA: peptidoglycan DD-metalloendopeptidase family protein, partial [Burkholderiaceae bacterium]|nr:peptidoglycan DD-metalloendopeptidase family protein [Burkholderiaceae bacterium]
RATASASVDFARLRGQLAPPVQGKLSARFGQRRALEGAGKAPTWKGIFIQAQEGTEVRAVAAGQVLFADWLRGFGNLIILDHGDGFLSVYGNNEKLLRQNGESVQAGQAIASVGNTGAHEQAGLYFEIRANGQAIDPLKWVLLR